MAEVQSANASETAPRRGPGIMAVVKATAFVSVIVILEVAAATVFFPSAEDTRRTGEALVADNDEADAGEKGGQPNDGASEEHAGPGSKEVALGTYHVVSFNPATGTSMSIDFELFGVVLAEDEADFAERYLLHERRLNEQVTIAIRGMESADFTDPGLGLIKRIILEKVNRALGKTLVREAVFSGFSFNERR